MSAPEILAALLDLYRDRSHYIPLPELANSTGWDGTRKMDLVVMNCWKAKPYLGPSLHAFEIKVSVEDWNRELRQPDKAQAIARYCNTMSVVVPDGIWTRLNRVPTGWGVLGVDEDRKVVTRRKPKPRAADPAPTGFVAAMLRRSWEGGLNAREAIR